MNSIYDYLSSIAEDAPLKLVISKPASKDETCRKIVIDRKGEYFQLSKYTGTQVFHENIPCGQLITRCAGLLDHDYLQLNAWSKEKEYSL